MTLVKQKIVALFGGLAVSAGLFALGLALLVPSLFVRSSAPRAVFTPQKHDFGKVRQNASLTHSFELKNTSNETLEVVGYYQSCKCTEFPRDLMKRRLAPGASVDVPITMATASGDDRVSAGAYLYLQPVGGSSADVEIVGVELTALVEPDFRLHPSRLDFQTIGEDAPATALMRMAPLAEPDARFTSVRTTAREVSAEIDPASDGRAVRVTVDPAGVHQEKRLSARVFYQTTAPHCREGSVAVEAHIVPAVVVDPPELVLTTAPGRTKTTLTVRSKAPSQIVRVDGLPPHWSQQSTPGVSTRHKVEIQGDAASPLRSELRLDVATQASAEVSPRLYQLSIPFSVLQVQGEPP
jgi:hypothetical protein